VPPPGTIPSSITRAVAWHGVFNFEFLRFHLGLGGGTGFDHRHAAANSQTFWELSYRSPRSFLNLLLS